MLNKQSISDLPAIKFDGIYRVLACIPSTPESYESIPVFGSKFAAALDPSSWQEIDLSWHNPPILDQGSTSSCTAHAACSGMEVCYLQSGRKLVEFNPYFVYGLINGGRDAGSMISDAMKALIQNGICLKEDLPSGVMYQRQFPQQAFENAKRFRLENAFRCPTFNDICSAISLGFICPLGILVGSNFPNVDSEGIAPLPRGGGGGHAILGLGLKKSQRYGWLIKIQNSWGCYDEETEILTNRGWVKFNELTELDSVATLSSSNNLEYQKPLERQVYDYSGELYHFKSRDVDLLVTPNHNMYVKPINSDKWALKQAADCPKHLHMKKDAVWEGEEQEYYRFDSYEIKMDDWLEFLGYFISEGFTTERSQKVPAWTGIQRIKTYGGPGRDLKTGRFTESTGPLTITIKPRIEKVRKLNVYHIGICQNKIYNIEKIDTCLKKLPFKFCRTKYGWVCCCKSLLRHLRDIVGVHSWERRIPRNILSLSSRQLHILYNAIMLGDGHIGKDKSKATYYTSCKELANDFQELVLRIGYAANISYTNRIGRENSGGITRHIEYKVGIKRKQTEPKSGYYPIIESYIGKVYCVTVPNGIIYVRRNGKAVWCGNSKFSNQGYAYIHKGHFQSMPPDAFAIQTVIDDPQDKTPEDEVPVVTN
jgi:hypothetical protein